MDKNLQEDAICVQYSGLDLTVTLIKEETHTITFENADNGKVAVAKSSAPIKTGDNVLLFVTPDQGYTLKSLTIKDSDNNTIKCNNDLWAMNSFFCMPDADVTVTPIMNP